MIPFSEKDRKETPSVSNDQMEQIYKELQTPYKWGAVVKMEHHLTDCPTIFRKEGLWYMMYTAIDPGAENMGYDTYLAVSSDLLHWEEKGKILTRSKEGWDGCQVDAGLALLDTAWEGEHALHSYGGKYWATYLGGALPGYETPPLHIGLACSDDPTQAIEWERKAQPILRMDDKDSRWFETFTLYKSYVFRDEEETLGYPFVMFYNCKGAADMPERIGLAVSKDMENWERYGANPVIDNGDIRGNFISGDPQIIKMGDVWVMNYFIAMSEDGKCTAFDTFAVSRDLVNWRKWEGRPLVEPKEEWENTFAHKPFVLKHNGVVYHYYCACNDKEERFIAVATSKEM